MLCDGRILVGVDLVDDHLLLAFQLPFGEGRVEGDVGDQLHGLREVAAQRRGVDRRLLLRREGVQLAAEVLQATVDLPGAAPLRPLEEGVLGEVRQPVFVGPFVAAPRADHQRAVRHRPLHLAVDAPDAVGQRVCCEFPIHRSVFRVWPKRPPYGLPRSAPARAASPRRRRCRRRCPPRARGPRPSRRT